jgi:hypothetical protein
MAKRERGPLRPLRVPLDFDEAIKALLDTPPPPKGSPPPKRKAVKKRRAQKR